MVQFRGTIVPQNGTVFSPRKTMSAQRHISHQLFAQAVSRQWSEPLEMESERRPSPLPSRDERNRTTAELEVVSSLPKIAPRPARVTWIRAGS